MTSKATAAPAQPGLLAVTGLEATHQHIVLLNGKRDRLLAAQLAAEEQFLTHVARLREAGSLSEAELALIYGSYADCAAPGYMKRWKAAIPVSAARLQRLLRSPGRGAPNMPDGTWRGAWPLAEDAPLPPAGACVVYVLYDAANEPCYVGSSQNLRARLRSHKTAGKEFAWWTAFACADRETAYRLEERLRSEYQPYLNKKRSR